MVYSFVGPAIRRRPDWHRQHAAERVDWACGRCLTETATEHTHALAACSSGSAITSGWGKCKCICTRTHIHTPTSRCWTSGSTTWQVSRRSSNDFEYVIPSQKLSLYTHTRHMLWRVLTWLMFCACLSQAPVIPLSDCFAVLSFVQQLSWALRSYELAYVLVKCLCMICMCMCSYVCKCACVCVNIYIFCIFLLVLVAL